ncbi:SymE family type I addiction module toxin [Pectobacterium peruviense]|uniref:SymE family type I addiction module toxin n=1 Tax=Pectobacterium peruviense TaxID=2066479 RepID=UPI000DE27600
MAAVAACAARWKSLPRATEVKESQRHYTVGYAPNGGKKPHSPQLKLSGKWLEELGFKTGQPVIVTVERG